VGNVEVLTKPRVHAYHVTPCLSARLQCLHKLSLNLRWSWHHPTIELFRTLDADLWEETGHNPRLILGASTRSGWPNSAAMRLFSRRWTVSPRIWMSTLPAPAGSP